MSLLDAVEAVGQEAAYRVDTQVIGSNDETTKQLLAIANRVIREMATEYPWPQLRKQHTISLVDGTSTYALPTDIDWMQTETMWNRSKSWPLVGPISVQERQQILSGYTTFVWDRFQIRGMGTAQLELFPTPGAADSGSTLAFEYISDRCVRPRTWATGLTISAIGEYIFYNGNYYSATTTGTTGATPPTWTTGTQSDGGVSWAYYSGSYAQFLADTDEPVISQRVLELGMLERFSERKGVEFQPRYLVQLRQEYAKAEPGKYVYMNSSRYRPFLWVNRLTGV